MLIGIGFGAFTLNQSKAYDEALEAYSSGNYSQAAEDFQKLGNYKDAASMYDKSTKWVEAQKAEGAANNSHTVKSWQAAAEAYEAIGDDAAKQKIAWCNENIDYWTAMDMLEQKPTDRDTVTKALELFQKCKNIDYISARIEYCNDVLDYYKAADLAAQGHYYDAYKMYDRIGIDAAAKLGDVDAKRDSCVQSSPGNGTVYHNDGYSDSCELTIVNEGNPNAYYKLYIGDDLVVTAFVNAGESATFMLPAGSYSMNKAYGDKWFGPDDMFGDEGSYFVCSFGIMGALFCITGNPVMCVIGILLCEAAYGGNFSVLPSLLEKRYGINNASRIHAMTLTGWSVGGIFGPLLANTFTGTTLYIVLAILYFIAFTVMEMNVRK